MHRGMTQYQSINTGTIFPTLVPLDASFSTHLENNAARTHTADDEGHADEDGEDGA